jgi:hypothetical protein
MTMSAAETNQGPAMTETEWLRSDNPSAMLDACSASSRKLRLFACACCRQLWHLLNDSDGRRTVEVAERYTDGEATMEELAAACRDARAAPSLAAWTAAALAERAPRAAARAAAQSASYYAVLGGGQFLPGVWATQDGVRATQAALLREVVGNPFRAVKIPALSPRSVPRMLATSIYAEHRWGDLPVLADALEEAGCDDAEILGHCRGAGGHVRGCFVVDLLLGKT